MCIHEIIKIMSKIVKLIFVFCFFAILSSCRTNKDSTYFNNTTDNQLLPTSLSNIQDYKIKEGDNLYVDIKSMSEEINSLFSNTKGTSSVGVSQNYGTSTAQYLSGYTVKIDGSIKLPLLGRIHVEGLSLDECVKAVSLSCGQYVKDAVVSVKLLNFTITVLGEVKRPGRYDNYKKNMTILDAIAMSNGISDYAKLQKILLMRTTSKGAKTYRLDLTSSKCMNSEAFFLQPNDVVYVEPDGYKSIKKNSPLISLMLSSISTLILVLNLL